MLTSDMLEQLNKKFPKENVLSEIEERYAYSCDASYNPEREQGIADVVLFVELIEDIQNAVKIANKFSVPIICRGAGTNTVGACVPVHGGIILNFSKMNKILDINPQNMTARVQPGVIVGDLQNEVENLGLFYPPDPSNLRVSTIGGSIAQNSAGARSFKYGTTKDYVLELVVVMADGKIIRTGSNTIKNSAGYNMSSLFVGSEGTLGIVAEATLKLIPKPEVSQVLMAYYDSTERSILSVNKIIESRIFPSTIDFMDKNALLTVKQFYQSDLIYDKNAALIIELDGDNSSVSYQKDKVLEILESDAVSVICSNNEKEVNEIWNIRHSSMAACARLKPNVTTDDIIVPRENLSKLISGIQNICDKYSLSPCLVGHVGDGSVHPQIPIDYEDIDEYNRYKLAKSEMYDLTVQLGGCISSEHGIGLEKKESFSKISDSGYLEYLRSIKKVFDPNNILNPYKIF